MIHKGITLAHGCFKHPWRKAHRKKPSCYACYVCVLAWNMSHPKDKVKFGRIR